MIIKVSFNIAPYLSVPIFAKKGSCDKLGRISVLDGRRIQDSIDLRGFIGKYPMMVSPKAQRKDKQAEQKKVG